MELDPNMTIREWVERDLDEAAWFILSSAVHSIESKVYTHGGGYRVLKGTTDEFMQNHEAQHPAWISEVRAVLEAHKQDGYEWPGSGPKGP